MATNNHNLPMSTLTAIEDLTPEQLNAIRANLRLGKFADGEDSDEFAREAVAQYVADGGDVHDLLG